METQKDGSIGRVAETERIRALLTSVSTGAGGAVVVTGPAGIGKTALLRDIERGARSEVRPAGEEIAVSHVVGAEAERDWPFSGLHLVLSAVADSLRPHCYEDAARRVRTFVGGLQTTATPYDVAIRLQSMIGDVKTPMLIMVDDAHLLDSGSKEAVGFVARRLRSAPLVVALAVDPSENSAVFQGLDTIHLEELSAPDAVRLFCRSGSRPVRPRVAEQIVARAGGNPGVLIDLRERVPDGQLAGRVELDRYLPRSPVLQSLYLPELAELDKSRRTALLTAAVSGDGRIAPVLHALREHGDSTVAWLLNEHVDRSDGSFTLRPRAVASVVWQVASLNERRRAHERLAASYPDDDDQRLWHRALATVDEDEDLAADVQKVVERARNRGEVERALAFARESVRLTANSAVRVDRMIVAGGLALAGGKFEEVIDIARERFTRDTTAIQRADLVLLEVRARSLLDGDVATGLISRHSEEIADVDPNRAARLNLAGAIGFAWRMEQAEARQLLTRAELYADHYDDTTGDLYRCTAAWIASISGEPHSAAKLIEESPPSTDVLSDAEWSIWRAMVLVRAERFDEARRLVRNVTLDGRFGRVSLVQSLAQSVTIKLEMLAGRLVAAEEAASAWERAATGGVWQALVSAHMIRVNALRGRSDLAWECRQQAVENARRHGDWWATALVQAETGALLLLSGRLDEAVPVLEHARRYALEHSDPSILPVEPDYIEACVRAGDTARAEAALADFDERARKVPTAWARHTLARCQALVAVGAESVGLFERAVEEQDEFVSPLELARTMLCYGERLRRLGHKVDAARWLYRAMVLAQESDAAVFVSRAAEELRSAGRAPVSAAVGVEELTEAERRVSALVAVGKRNREIAAELFVSVRTVETHLGKIFRKLGIRSRTELARLVAAVQDVAGEAVEE
ncbi:helix-turn-helix transcriptional regulator [Phytoactinopolyspora mesophila]|uniref:AAA family ATPase n=1 Tax=Phytoactinopolyspora mesophila TaxID=2650750 RepID=A0A7K3M5L0_9ACTN|nr:LuxR family transcriptional regulator [Phytoactinopolyspora mesophila]NDL58604.1 AAA family ATPase [Phytoactinopolyspora mesophila]